MQGSEDPVLGSEVVHDRALGHAELLRDQPEVDAIVPDLGDVSREGVEDLVVPSSTSRHQVLLLSAGCRRVVLQPSLEAPDRTSGQANFALRSRLRIFPWG